MQQNLFNPGMLSDEDFRTAGKIVRAVGKTLSHPDVCIRPLGNDYIFRWHLLPRRAVGANCYFHIQVASDPERPLHDHPWDNTSVILAGRYLELMDTLDGDGEQLHERHTGDVIHRKATHAHRLILPPDVPYAMTLFTTGTVLREWGFWSDDGWVDQISYNEKERANV